MAAGTLAGKATVDWLGDEVDCEGCVVANCELFALGRVKLFVWRFEVNGADEDWLDSGPWLDVSLIGR